VIQAEVRRMLASGMGRADILDHYVQEYGERILAKPKKTGFNLAVYWVPYLAILVGASVIFLLVRRGIGRHRGPVLAEATSGSGPASPPAAAPRAGSEEAYRQRLEEEVRRSR
jgi:cytochrome c-type biogenesis protein CcmH/NrfF